MQNELIIGNERGFHKNKRREIKMVRCTKKSDRFILEHINIFPSFPTKYFNWFYKTRWRFSRKHYMNYNYTLVSSPYWNWHNKQEMHQRGQFSKNGKTADFAFAVVNVAIKTNKRSEVSRLRAWPQHCERYNSAK